MHSRREFLQLASITAMLMGVIIQMPLLNKKSQKMIYSNRWREGQNYYR